MFPAIRVNEAVKDARKTETKEIFSREQINAATITDTNVILALIGLIIFKTAVILFFNAT